MQIVDLEKSVNIPQKNFIKSNIDSSNLIVPTFLKNSSEIRNNTNEEDTDLISSQQPTQSIIHEEEEKDYEIELNENGIAEATEKNMIILLELVKEKECLWNYTWPTEKRNSYVISRAWFSIAKKFSGKSKDFF